MVETLWSAIALMPMQIRIRIRLSISMPILPQVYTCWKIIFFYCFYSHYCKFTQFYLSRQYYRCQIIFQYFWTAVYFEIFWKKYISSDFIFTFCCLRIKIRIRNNDAGKTGSGSTTLEETIVAIQLTGGGAIVLLPKNTQNVVVLKGQCHEIFDFCFFFMNQFPPCP